MSKSGKKKKIYKFTVRLDESTQKFLDVYSKITSIKKSKLIRNSISNLIFLNLDNPDYPNPKAIMSQSLLHFLFDKCSDEEIKEMAQISYDLSLKEIGSLNNPEASNIPTDLVDLNNVEAMTEGLVKYIFSSKGHGWFDEVSFVKRGNNITIYGKHNMGPKFHLFIKELLNLYYANYKYSIIRERKQNLRKLIEKYDMREVKRRFYGLSFTLGPDQ